MPALAPGTPRVRTRLTRATATVICEGGDEHTVSLTADGQAVTPHDADVDAVVSALGGDLHPCGKVLASFQAAREIVDAAAGRRDLATATRNRRGWTDSVTCPSCAYGTVSHLLSAEHRATAHGGYPSTVRTLTAWLARNTSDELLTIKPRGVLSNDSTFDRLLALGEVPRILHPRILEPDLAMHPSFVAPAAALVGADPHRVQEFRRNGASIQWVRRLAASARPQMLQAARERDTAWVRTLTHARNVSADVVAEYINAGIYAHFHTYAKVGARPADILAVFHGSRGQTTLASLLKDGSTIPDAVARYAA